MYRLRRDGLAWSDVSGETILLDLNSSVYFSAKGTSSGLVHQLADGATADMLVKHLTENYTVDEETARRDIEDFLEELGRRGLLEPIDD